MLLLHTQLPQLLLLTCCPAQWAAMCNAMQCWVRDLMLLLLLLLLLLLTCCPAQLAAPGV
jgi:hypothetical protein